MTDFRTGLIAAAVIVGMTALAPMAAQSQTSAQPTMQMQQKSQMGTQQKSQMGMQHGMNHSKMHASHQVTMMQQKLNASGAGLKVDGRMGPKTKAALADYQRSHGMKPTGKMDSKTREMMMKG